jgi:hypothetical protein
MSPRLCLDLESAEQTFRVQLPSDCSGLQDTADNPATRRLIGIVVESTDLTVNPTFNSQLI